MGLSLSSRWRWRWSERRTCVVLVDGRAERDDVRRGGRQAVDLREIRVRVARDARVQLRAAPAHTYN